jgi:hypothetical protein
VPTDERARGSLVTIVADAAIGAAKAGITMNAKNISYWISTLLVCAFMSFSAFSSLTHQPQTNESMASLGYPSYMQNILGAAYICGVIALLVPGMPILKEWAYAGFTVNFIGAFFSHLAMNQQKMLMLPLVSMIVLAISYLLRPASRRAMAMPHEIEVSPRPEDRGYPSGATPAH